ncbi:hypothetical protein COJ96_25285, partial [Bacillus sp. AFS073361]|uniref:hypothetical protein n=1 Tax=Bacillus sp. AFS073361 TaxID=2033511 RepID=UPI000C014E93
LHAALGGLPSHVSTGQKPYHSFVMPIQGVEASYANGMGLALLWNKPGTPYMFEILRISQHSITVKLTITFSYYLLESFLLGNSKVFLRIYKFLCC